VSYRVLYFAALGEAAGCAGEAWPATAATPRALYAELRARHGFAFDADRLRVAVNGAFAGWERPLTDGDEIVFVPPVSGG
jgi:molybdopterin synthase sulfur carrier subunit